MCCFSRPVEKVTATNMFARPTGRGTQFLVYSMNLEASEDLAMILPLPVPPDSPEDALTFIRFEDLPDFFEQIARCFIPPPFGGLSIGAQESPLPVFDVGAFEASFVPKQSEFHRLDSRFRMPDSAWSGIEEYADYGFAVFKLKDWAGSRKKTVHPMAFEFPVRDPESIFFPTVHIHDGRFHPEAEFDHVLYFQTGEDADPRFANPNAAEVFQQGAPFTTAEHHACTLDPEASHGVVLDEPDLYRQFLRGVLPNGDTHIAVHPA